MFVKIGMPPGNAETENKFRAMAPFFIVRRDLLLSYLRFDFSARCLRIPAFMIAEAEPWEPVRYAFFLAFVRTLPSSNSRLFDLWKTMPSCIAFCTSCRLALRINLCN